MKDSVLHAVTIAAAKMETYHFDHQNHTEMNNHTNINKHAELKNETELN